MRRRTARGRRRKGQLTIPFHLIFTIVGGALFLLFFFILIRSVVKAGTDTNVRDLTFSTETIISTSMTNPESFTIANLQPATFLFICSDQGRESYVRPTGEGIDMESQTLITDSLQHVPLFSPRVVRGDELFTSTRTWKVPFPVGSLVMLSNNRTHYIFIDTVSNDVYQYLEEENLDAYSIEFVSTSNINSIEPRGYDQYRVIFFDIQGSSFPGWLLQAQQRLDGEEVTFLRVEIDEPYDQGKLFFYDKEHYTAQEVTDPANYHELTFFGSAMLDAAVFSENYALFSCNMEKAVRRFGTTLEILKLRAADLADDPITTDFPDECSDIFNDYGVPYLDQYSDATDLGGFSNAIQSGAVDNLETTYNQLLMEDCPLLY